jgi:hypothetical protein
MALPLKFLAGPILPLLCACNQAGNVQQTINAATINAQDARDDADVRSARLEELADDLNAQAARAGGARGRALRAEAGQDSNAALAVLVSGETKAEAIDRTIGADLNAAGNR